MPGSTAAATARHVDAVEALGARTVASAHGPVLRGEPLDDAFDRLRGLAGAPIIPTPGQELLDSAHRLHAGGG